MKSFCFISCARTCGLDVRSDPGSNLRICPFPFSDLSLSQVDQVDQVDGRCCFGNLGARQIGKILVEMGYMVPHGFILNGSEATGVIKVLIYPIGI